MVGKDSMNGLRFRLLIFGFFLLLMPVTSHGQAFASNNVSGSHQHSSSNRWRLAPTEAFQQEGVRLMIEEADRIARDLNLKEELPITKSNLVSGFVNPPAAFIHGSGL